jgi:hypothetical protein
MKGYTKNRKFWEKHIFGKIFYSYEWGDIKYNFFVHEWYCSKPSYIVERIRKKHSDKYYLFYSEAEGEWRLMGNDFCDVFSYITLECEGDWFPTKFLAIFPDSGEVLLAFDRGIKKIKKELSYFSGVYLRSSFLPKELVAHIFSFIRRCEIEKNKKSLLL